MNPFAKAFKCNQDFSLTPEKILFVIKKILYSLKRLTSSQQSRPGRVRYILELQVDLLRLDTIHGERRRDTVLRNGEQLQL